MVRRHTVRLKELYKLLDAEENRFHELDDKLIHVSNDELVGINNNMEKCSQTIGDILVKIEREEEIEERMRQEKRTKEEKILLQNLRRLSHSQ